MTYGKTIKENTFSQRMRTMKRCNGPCGLEHHSDELRAGRCIDCWRKRADRLTEMVKEKPLKKRRKKPIVYNKAK